MQFSDTSNLTGLVEDIDFICSTDSTSYPLKDKARNVNRWQYKAVLWYMSAQKKWKYDDSNLTTLPEITTTLVNSQSDYALPSNIFNVEAVEILNNAGDYVRLTPISIEEIPGAISEFESTDGTPKYYRLTGESIILYPAPATGSVTMADGLKAHVTREFDHFVSTDTTQEPGLPEPFHRILSLGAAYDYLIVNGTQEKSVAVRQELEQLKNDMIKFVGQRNSEQKTAVRPATLSSRSYYR
jgi:hypothetical protein